MRRPITAILLTLATLGAVRSAEAGCGCDKPPPPRAAVRPFVAFADARITIFDNRLLAGLNYRVQFVSRDGSSDWSRGKAGLRKDLADKTMRMALRVKVPGS